MAVFISASSHDKATLQKLTAEFRFAGVEVWWGTELAGLEISWPSILAQIRRCDVFVFALSRNSVDSKLCLAELQYVQALGKPILPVQIGSLERSQLNPFAATDIYHYDDQNPEESVAKVITRLRIARAQAHPMPDPLPPEPSIPFVEAPKNPPEQPKQGEPAKVLASKQGPQPGMPDKPPTAPQKPDGSRGIFISYRRGNESNFAGRLYDNLTRHFGDDHVFIDVDSIDLGLDFTNVIDRKLAQCSVMLVVIGKEWATITGSDGRPRLQNKDDFVRVEVEAALSREDLRVIPVYADGAAPPVASELPDSLGGLARRQGLEISHSTFGSDFGRLLRYLKRMLAQGA